MGFFDIIKDYRKEKREEKEKQEAKINEIKDAEQESYFEAKKEEAKILGKVRVKLERDEKIKQLKKDINVRGGKGITSAIIERIRIASENLYGNDRGFPKERGKKKERVNILGGSL